MNSPHSPRARLAGWEQDGAAIRAIRNRVFSLEQGISESLDFDGRDPGCAHLLASLENGEPVGTARMLPDGHVGRIAVHKSWRGQGVGTRLVERLIELAREQGLAEVYLHAQARAADFYARLGFETRGDRFMEAGMEHILMVRVL